MIDLFAGALVPGLLLGSVYILYLIGVAIMSPETCPAYYETGVSMRNLAGRVISAFLPPVLLVAAVLQVLVVELLNSAVESAVDRVGEAEHPLSGRAKDMGSAAVLASLVLAVAVWALVLLG